MRNPGRMQLFRALQPGTLNVEPLNLGNIIILYEFTEGGQNEDTGGL